MGQHAEDIINGDVDEQTGDWIGSGDGFPRTFTKGVYEQTPRKMKDHDPSRFAKSTKNIRRELAILIRNTKIDHPEVNESVIVNNCRSAMNTKYGKGWREQYLK